MSLFSQDSAVSEEDFIISPLPHTLDIDFANLSPLRVFESEENNFFPVPTTPFNSPQNSHFSDILRKEGEICIYNLVKLVREKKKFIQRRKHSQEKEILKTLTGSWVFSLSVFPDPQNESTSELQEFVNHVNLFFPRPVIGSISINRAPEISEYLILCMYFLDKRQANGTFIFYSPRLNLFFRNNICKISSHIYRKQIERGELQNYFSSSSEVSIMQYVYNFANTFDEDNFTFRAIPFYLGKVSHKNWKSYVNLERDFGPRVREFSAIPKVSSSLQRELHKKKKMNSKCINGTDCFCKDGKHDLISDITQEAQDLLRHLFENELSHFSQQIQYSRYIKTT